MVIWSFTSSISQRARTPLGGSLPTDGKRAERGFAVHFDACERPRLHSTIGNMIDGDGDGDGDDNGDGDGDGDGDVQSSPACCWLRSGHHFEIIAGFEALGVQKCGGAEIQTCCWRSCTSKKGVYV